MKKVLLVQLAIPRINTLEYKSNVHLAPGYLKAYADYHLRPEEHITISIMPRIYTDLMGDKAVINYILNVDPDIISFSLYLWNIEKSLFIASQIKLQRPQIKIIFGGPEVNSDNKYLLTSNIFQQGFSGEGEIAFTRYLRGDNIEQISGAIYLKNGNVISNGKSEIVQELRKEYNPYLSGAIQKEVDECIFFETVRGCPFSCSFCYYNKMYDKVKQLPEDIIEACLTYAQTHQFKEAFLLDPSFNVQPGFDKMLDRLINSNKNKQLEFHTELRADLLTENQIKKLSKLNLKGVEIGLQSTNHSALEHMNRQQNLNKFVKNTKRMQQEGINCKVDLIVGLPYDSLDGFKTSVNFVKDNELDDDVQVFNLSILSGTEYAGRSQELGLEIMQEPPYYLEATPQFSATDIEDAFTYAEDVFETALDPEQDSFLSCDFSAITTKDFLTFPTSTDYINKIIISDYSPAAKQKIINLTERYCESVTIHFKITDLGSQYQDISDILSQLTTHMPLYMFDIILEFNNDFAEELLQELLQSVQVNFKHFVNLDIKPFAGGAVISTRLSIIIPEKFSGSDWLQDLAQNHEIYLHCTSENNCLDTQQQKKFEQFARDNTPLYICGKYQSNIFNFLAGNELLNDNIIFDDFRWEMAKLKQLNEQIRYYLPRVVVC